MATVLIGYMGAGKSSAARALSERPADTDALVEQRLGAPIAEVFEQQGEATFRAAEEEVVLEALAAAGEDGVVSLGGGATGSPRVRDALAAHTVVWLDVSLDTAWERVARKPGKRPLASDRDAFGDLFAQRREQYASLADVTLPEGADIESAAAAIELLGKAPAPLRMTWAVAGQYPVVIGPGALALAGADWAVGPARRHVLTDANVGRLYAGAVPDAAGLIEIPAGEQHKSLATAAIAWEALAEQGATRSDLLLALGGGVVGDLAGFVAASYQRGIGVVQLPTTLVAMVDSALGGKTGVDLPAAKNYVGAFHQPRAVIADTDTLATLPGEEQAAGYAEVLKTALIAGGALWERIGAGEAVDDDVILRCARTKLAIVAADEREGGERQLLNLGHTVAHALETVTGYRALRHGEAVAIGLLAALRLSGQDALREQVSELLARAGLPTSFAGADPDAVVATTRRDKKRVGDSVPFVLVNAPGDVVYGQRVDDGELRAAVAEIIAP